MKTNLDCIPCFFRQALDACRFLSVSEDKTKLILDAISKKIPELKLNSTPSEMAVEIHRIIKNDINHEDPYKEIKKKSNDIALTMYDELKLELDKADNRLLVVLRLAIAGNIIDYGAIENHDVKKEVESLVDFEKTRINKNKSEFFYSGRFFT